MNRKERNENESNFELLFSFLFEKSNSFVDWKGFFFDPTIFEKDKTMRLSYLLEKMLIFLFFS